MGPKSAPSEKAWAADDLQLIRCSASPMAASIVFCLVLVAFKIWLAASQSISAVGPSQHDDFHFITQAEYILQGGWLGPYDQLTLIKGPFFPAWIALAFTAGVPLLLSAQLLYAGSCLLFVRAMRPFLIVKYAGPILFAFLLFNPQSTAAQLTRVIREMISPALTMLVAACTLGLLFRQSRPARSTWHWAAGLGISMAALWLTREEGLALLPFIGFTAAAAGLGAWVDRSKYSWSGPAKRWLMASALFAALVLTVATTNLRYYGVFAKTEFDVASYKAAYGALSRVIPSEFKPLVPVAKETRRRIYRVSPAFDELKPYIEGIPGSYWEAYSEFQQDETNRHEILAGWFSWALRDAVASAGYYSEGRYPDAYYRRLAAEVNVACEDMLLACSSPRATLVPVWHNAYALQVAPEFVERLAEAIGFQGVELTSRPSLGTPEELAAFRRLTRGRLTPMSASEPTGENDTAGAQVESAELEGQPDVRRGVLAGILQAYQLLTPALLIPALIFYCYLTYDYLRRRSADLLWAALTGLMILWFSRTALVAFLDVTSLRIPAGSYLHEAHPIMIAFIGLGCVGAVQLLQRRAGPPDSGGR